ncbi:MAG: hypothetical protein LH624_19280 [Cryobacterium sp.]|nr:hypothetical protein [Cryobacterium sp.]
MKQPALGIAWLAAPVMWMAFATLAGAEDPVCPSGCTCDVQNSVGATRNSSPCWVLPGSFVTVTYDLIGKGCCEIP